MSYLCLFSQLALNFCSAPPTATSLPVYTSHGSLTFFWAGSHPPSPALFHERSWARLKPTSKTYQVAHEDEEEEEKRRIWNISDFSSVESHLLPAACGSSGEDKYIRNDFLSVAPFEGREAAPTTLTPSNPADFPLNLTRGHGRGPKKKNKTCLSCWWSANEFNFILVRGRRIMA